MADVARKRELGRGERVLPGVYRLRLPLPWPGVPHCNAWAVRSDGGFVLFDTGMHEPDSLEQLERALEMCDLRLEDTRLVACTHAHTDHCGQGPTILEAAGCELWMHPSHESLDRMIEDPEALFERRLEVARQSGVPAEPLARYAAERRPAGSGIAGPIHPQRDLVTGVGIETDLGEWITYETPGHAPNHVCFFQPDRRLLISGDHLLGRISLFFDYGYSPDPVGEFLRSLGTVEGLSARLCLAGHGRTFADIQSHIRGNRALVQERLDLVQGALQEGEQTAFEIIPRVYGQAPGSRNAHWLLSETLCFLTHLQAQGLARRIAGEPERWRAA